MTHVTENTGERFAQELIGLHQSYEKRLTNLENQIEDLRDTLSYYRTRNEETFPSAMVERLINGENSVLVYRDYRGLSQAALSEKSGIRQSLLSEIESGKKTGSVATLKALAQALEVDIDDLV